ncbi:MAG: hypothetical protein U1F07_05880 [Rubrivivax sp.]
MPSSQLQGPDGAPERRDDPDPSDPVPATPHASFAFQHRRLERRLRAHLMALVGADFAGSLAHLERWHAALLQHIEIEETLLLPALPAGARWGERIYRVEHERIRLLADAYLQRIRAATAQAPEGERARRAAVLALLDAAHALRHLLEHHHEREEMALAQELPAALQRRAWSRLQAADRAGPTVP